MKSMIVGLAVLSGCNLVLGLSEPTQQGDAGIPGDTTDAVDPMPGMVRVNMGGTGAQGVVTSVPAGINCPGTCEFTFPVGTEVTLSATPPGPGTVTFTGFFQGGCTGGQTCTITPSGTVDVFARYFTPENLWFTSSKVYKPGAFDGVANADKECDRLAAEAGLIERKYIAWLPSTTKTAMQHLQEQSIMGLPASVWRRPDGELFAFDSLDIPQGKIRFPPRLDEFGRDVGDDAVVVTDTLANGQSNAGTHCSDWASETGADVIAGEAAGGTGRFTEASLTACNADAHIYCLAAVDNAAALIGSLTSSVVFVTFPTVKGNATVQAMDNLCDAEGQSLGLPTTRALVTPGGGATVKDRFVEFGFSPDPVVRPDGVVIAPNMDALLDGAPFAASPNVAADLEYRNDSVWVGGGSFATFTSDCNGWTSTGGFGTTRFAATTRGETFAQQDMCNQDRHVLCFTGLVAMAKPKPPTAGNRQPKTTPPRR